MEIKKTITKKLFEAKYLVKLDSLDQVVDKMTDKDTVKVVDESSDDEGRWVFPEPHGPGKQFTDLEYYNYLKNNPEKDSDGSQMSKVVSILKKKGKLSETGGVISPMAFDEEYEKLSRSEERTSNSVSPKMTKKEMVETVLKFINNGKKRIS